MEVELEQAQTILLNLTETMPVERQELADCWLRVLAENVTAKQDFPPFDRSPLDGYALIAEEVRDASKENPVYLQEIESIAAGMVAQRKVISGTACRIMTGAPIPSGATGVIRLEDTATTKKGIAVFSGESLGRNICRRGEEMSCGEIVLERGTVIKMGASGILASVGCANPLVYKRPQVAIIATGSELVTVDAELTAGKIRNSNSYMLAAQVREAGGTPHLIGTAADSVTDIIELLRRSEQYDLCLTTGGASVGDYDLMGDVFHQWGATLLFERVAMKPGMPVLAGNKKSKLYIGLSGNPAAAGISFEQLVRPMLLKMGGRKDWWRLRLRATLAVEYPKASLSRRFVWAVLHQEESGLYATPMRQQGNGMLGGGMRANALIAIPAESPPLAVGSEVEVQLLC